MLDIDLDALDVAYLVYVCNNCDHWHARFVGYLDPERRLAEAVRLIGEAHQGLGLVREIGLIAVAGKGDNPTLASLVSRGGLLTARRDSLPRQVLDMFEASLDMYIAEPAFEHLARYGTETIYADADWTRVLTEVLGGRQQQAQQTMSADEILKMWER